MESAYIGTRKRTERTAMAECKRQAEDWWERVGVHGVVVTPIRAVRKTRLGKFDGWHVDYVADLSRSTRG